MTEERVPISIEFNRVLETLAREIYDTPLAFVRENVQNAIDAIRMSRITEPSLVGRVDVQVSDREVTIRDNGIGMTRLELQHLFWTMGATGKNTPEARMAGCIGTFGIGGFANFGVCSELVVTSKKLGAEGWSSRLAKTDFSSPGVPKVTYTRDEGAGPQGTIILAIMNEPPVSDELKQYLKSFVRYAAEEVFFNGELISGDKLLSDERRKELPVINEALSVEDAVAGPIDLSLYHDDANVVIAYLQSSGESDQVQAALKFLNGPLQVFKRGFKLCDVSVSTVLGVQGRLDADFLQPTAGRDSLSAQSQSMVQTLVKTLESAAIGEIVKSSELLASNTRVLPELVSQNRLEDMDLLLVTLADGNTETLGSIRQFAESEGKVYFGRREDRDLLDVLQQSGNRIVMLSGDRNRQRAERAYLQGLCDAMPYEGLVEVKDRYDQVGLLELAFLANLEQVIRNRYEVRDFTVVPAALTGGIPVYTKGGKGKSLTVYVDVRHEEIRKLEPLGQSVLLYTMATEFCRTYLGSVLKSRSPKFFGTGALSFDDIVRRTTELWEIATDDIDVQMFGKEEPTSRRAAVSIGRPQTVVAADVHELEVGGEELTADPGHRRPKILHIIDRSGELGIEGFYFRVMDAPARVFGDDIQAMPESAVFWFGNRITYAFSDGSDTAFHYELRLQRMLEIASDDGGGGGMERLERPVQEYGGGMFIPIPDVLVPSLVPTERQEVIVRVNYEWFDLAGGRVWDATLAARVIRERSD